MLTEKRTVSPEVALTPSPYPPPPSYSMPFPDYNHDQEDSYFGIKERKHPLGPTRTYLHAMIITLLVSSQLNGGGGCHHKG